jgi:sec-independent protein translocase protein TatA
MPGWLGPWEIAIVVGIVLLVFGGRLIPRIGSSLGRSFIGLKKGIKEGEEGFRSAIKEDVPSDAETDAASEQPGTAADRDTTEGDR